MLEMTSQFFDKFGEKSLQKSQSDPQLNSLKYKKHKA